MPCNETININASESVSDKMQVMLEEIAMTLDKTLVRWRDEEKTGDPKVLLNKVYEFLEDKKKEAHDIFRRLLEISLKYEELENMITAAIISNRLSLGIVNNVEQVNSILRIKKDQEAIREVMMSTANLQNHLDEAIAERNKELGIEPPADESELKEMLETVPEVVSEVVSETVSKVTQEPTDITPEKAELAKQVQKGEAKTTPEEHQASTSIIAVDDVCQNINHQDIFVIITQTGFRKFSDHEAEIFRQEQHKETGLELEYVLVPLGCVTVRSRWLDSTYREKDLDYEEFAKYFRRIPADNLHNVLPQRVWMYLSTAIMARTIAKFSRLRSSGTESKESGDMTVDFYKDIIKPYVLYCGKDDKSFIVRTLDVILYANETQPTVLFEHIEKHSAVKTDMALTIEEFLDKFERTLGDTDTRFVKNADLPAVT